MKVAEIDFDKAGGLVPAVIQDEKNGIVYMLGFMNKHAFEKTIETKYVHFWSRKRNKLWMKGEESGNKLKVKEIKIDCDADSILVKVELLGKYVCHTGALSCFYQELE